MQRVVEVGQPPDHDPKPIELEGLFDPEILSRGKDRKCSKPCPNPNTPTQKDPDPDRIRLWE